MSVCGCASVCLLRVRGGRKPDWSSSRRKKIGHHGDGRLVRHQNGGSSKKRRSSQSVDSKLPKTTGPPAVATHTANRPSKLRLTVVILAWQAVPTWRRWPPGCPSPARQPSDGCPSPTILYLRHPSPKSGGGPTTRSSSSTFPVTATFDYFLTANRSMEIGNASSLLVQRHGNVVEPKKQIHQRH